MKTLLTCLLVLVMAGAAQAQVTFCYGWEDSGDALGCYNGENTDFYNDGTHVSEGVAALAAAKAQKEASEELGIESCCSKGERMAEADRLFAMADGDYGAGEGAVCVDEQAQ